MASCSSAAGGPTTSHTDKQIPTSTPTPKAQLTYVAIGASDTFGVGADDPSTENWAADLSTNLGSHVHLVNLGIPGIVLHQALKAELPIALDAHPQVITVWLAVNDLTSRVPLDSYTSDLNVLLTQLRKAAPTARIAIANVPDLTLLPVFSAMSLMDKPTLMKYIQAYNAIIASAAKQHGVLLVDLFAKWRELDQHPEYISNDGFHPSTLGYARIAEIFYQTLKAAS
ncbi:MAG: SGNH/GDSL hydrolase family protein [Chloroflexota bacterium]|nr:SGNH/GDSL hydrolase family protein [Chloroflexota bacterium]